MLTNSPAVRSTGARILFLLSAAVTVAILLWIHRMRLIGEPPRGMTPIFFFLFAHEDYGATVLAVLILLAAALIPAQSSVRGIFHWAGKHPSAIAVASLFVLCAGALTVYHDHPLSMDEYAAYFQSRVFAAGHLTGQFPPGRMDWLVPPGFQNFFLSVSHSTGQVASAYWPAYSLIMAPFTLLGVPWACNPVLTALTLLVVHRLALRLFDDTEAAGMALLLTAASPVFFGMGISYYSMPAHLLANSVYALLLLQPTALRAFAAGTVGAVALALHNPTPHILFAAPWLIWVATRKGGLRLLASLCAGYLPLCMLLGIGWFELTTHLRAEGSVAAPDSLTRFNAIANVFALPTSTVFLGRTIGVAKLWVWAVPGLLILACYGAVRERTNSICQLLAASALTTLIGYLFFPQDQGHGWGYRYFHSAWMALPLLATAALYPRVRVPAERPSSPGTLFDNGETRAFVASCVVLTLVLGTGFRVWQMQAFMARDLNQLPQYKGSEPRIVFVDLTDSFYGADLVQNDPFLRTNETRMLSNGADADARMIAQYYPAFHRVYEDRYGTVWSSAPTLETAP